MILSYYIRMHSVILEKCPDNVRVELFEYHENSGKLHPLQPSTGHKEFIGISTFYVGPRSSEELNPRVKGFTFIVREDP